MAKLIDPSYQILEKLDGIKILKHIEKIARTCYKSENLITEDGESAKRIVVSLIKLGHEAMIEHCAVTVRFVSDIGFYKDLTRHRLASFAIESTRWCNYSKDKFEKELKFIKPVNIEQGTSAYDHWWNCMKQIEQAYMAMADLGCKPDQLRMLLPHSIAAEINVTANLREWRHILKIRTKKDVHPSIRQLLIPLLKEFQSKIPVIFDDINIEH